MDFDEIKDRYKSLPFLGRLAIGFVIGILPVVYIYFDEEPPLIERLTEVQSQENMAREKLNNAKQQKNDLPKLEEQLSFTEEQLVQAKKFLPESIRIEELLQHTANLARKYNVQIISFTPLPEKKLEKGYPTVEIPIENVISGTYSAIAQFIDSMVRLQTPVFIKSVDLSPLNTSENLLHPSNKKLLGDGKNESSASKLIDLAKESRQFAREKAKIVMAIYRSQTDVEIQSKASSDPSSQGNSSSGSETSQSTSPEDGGSKSS